MLRSFLARGLKQGVACYRRFGIMTLYCFQNDLDTLGGSREFYPFGGSCGRRPHRGVSEHPRPVRPVLMAMKRTLITSGLRAGSSTIVGCVISPLARCEVSSRGFPSWRKGGVGIYVCVCVAVGRCSLFRHETRIPSSYKLYRVPSPTLHVHSRTRSRFISPPPDSVCTSVGF